MHAAQLTDDELHARVLAFEQWHYEIELRPGIVTPIFDADTAVRHRERERYVWDAVLEVCGGSLAGKRVLDLGCNAGFWALGALERGADFVLGIDGRQMHVNQANLVFETLAVNPARYRFTCSDVFDPTAYGEGQFDIVLCLGLLYHVSRPVQLFELMTAACSDLLVVDTTLAASGGSSFQLSPEDISDPRSALSDRFVLWPSRGAVRDMASASGMETVCLPPDFSDWTGSPDYASGRRSLFLCARSSDLRRFAGRAEEIEAT